jgi:hypothetical protein
MHMQEPRRLRRGSQRRRGWGWGRGTRDFGAIGQARLLAVAEAVITCEDRNGCAGWQTGMYKHGAGGDIRLVSRQAYN